MKTFILASVLSISSLANAGLYRSIEQKESIPKIGIDLHIYKCEDISKKQLEVFVFYNNSDYVYSQHATINNGITDNGAQAAGVFSFNPVNKTISFNLRMYTSPAKFNGWKNSTGELVWKAKYSANGVLKSFKSPSSGNNCMQFKPDVQYIVTFEHALKKEKNFIPSEAFYK